MSGTRIRPRRLPVFFLVDDSADMLGAMTVAASEGLQAFQRDIQAHDIGMRSVYLSVALLGEQAYTSSLTSLALFTMPPFQAQGECSLTPGLRHVQREIDDSVVADAPEQLRDLHPTVFVILGGAPKDDPDDLRAAVDSLAQLDGARQPRFFTITAARDHDALKLLGGQLLQMSHADGDTVANAFAWARELVIAICEMQARGEHDLNLPAYPVGITLVS